MDNNYKNALENLSSAVLDAREIIDGLIVIADDTLIRDMDFSRGKICVLSDTLKNLSRFLAEGVDAAEIIGKRAPSV